MIIKNYLTKNLKKSLLGIVDVNSNRTSYADRVNSSNNAFVLFNAFALQLSLCSSSQGGFSASPNNQNNQNYVKLSTPKIDQKKDSSGKAVDNKIIRKVQSKSIKLIISNILGFVKSKFADTFFKPKTRDFTLQDLKLVQKLLDKNKLDYPKAWAEFYKITGTNKNTFNN